MAGHSYSGNIASGLVQYGDIHGNVTNNHSVQNTFYLHQQRSLEIREEERIGATDCVAGLQTMASLLSQQINQCVTPSISSGRAMVKLQNEVAASMQLLDALHHHLTTSGLSPDRTSLISATCVITSLTNAVKLFDELYSALRHLATLESSADVSEGDFHVLSKLHDKLCWQTTYWKIQARVLECTANLHAHEASDVLNKHVATKLASDKDLATRMETLEQEVKELSLQMDESSGTPTIRTATVRTPTIRTAVMRATSTTAMLDLRHVDTPLPFYAGANREFEIALQESWVYQRNHHRSERLTIRSEWTRDSVWSELSELSMSQISILSVIALPLQISELRHGQVYRQPTGPNRVKFSSDATAKIGGTAGHSESAQAYELHVCCGIPTASLRHDQLATALKYMVGARNPTLFNKGYDAYDELSGVCTVLAECLPLSRNDLERSLAERNCFQESELATIRQLISRCDDLLKQLHHMRSWAGAACAVGFKGRHMKVVLEKWRIFLLQVVQIYFARPLRASPEHTTLEQGSWFGAFLNTITASSGRPRDRWMEELRYVRAALDLSQSFIHLEGENVIDPPAALMDVIGETVCELSLNCTSIENLPTAFAGLKWLRHLSITSGRLKDFPKALLKLWNLESLCLDHNKIAELPITMCEGLDSLKTLSVSHNKLLSLPKTISKMSRLCELHIDGNPFTDDFAIRDIINDLHPSWNDSGERAKSVCQSVKVCLQSSTKDYDEDSEARPEVFQSTRRSVDVQEQNMLAVVAAQQEQEVSYESTEPTLHELVRAAMHAEDSMVDHGDGRVQES